MNAARKLPPNVVVDLGRFGSVSAAVTREKGGYTEYRATIAGKVIVGGSYQSKAAERHFRTNAVCHLAGTANRTDLPYTDPE
jgi:hypothetical protein